MTEKKAEQKKAEFDPTVRAVADNFQTDFFGSKRWNPERFVNLCRMQGLIGTVWNHETLTAPLKLCVQNTRDYDEPKLDALLRSFASTIGFNEGALRRHFYAIKFGVEDQFLAAVRLAEEKRAKLERLAEEAETEAPEKEETEEMESGAD